jgi:hypothetical protein
MAGCGAVSLSCSFAELFHFGLYRTQLVLFASDSFTFCLCLVACATSQNQAGTISLLALTFQFLFFFAEGV